jgi:DNA-binding response OmpR family regulator
MLKSHILIVDDSRTIRFQIKQSFESEDQENFNFTEAEDGHQAFRWLVRQSINTLPDLIILDRNMPNLNGDEFIKIIKDDELWRQIPILFLTTHGEIDEIVKGLSQLQADDYLAKPFNQHELVARVKALIRIKQAENEARKLSEELQVALQEQVKSRKKIEELHRLTTDSIEYASLIQKAILPTQAKLHQFFEDSFVIWQPRNIVGGDIFFFDTFNNNNECLIMVIDCTGHGVPGAFVTMLVKAIKEQILTEISFDKGIISPAKILALFNKKMKVLLKQTHPKSESNVGFDGGVLYYNIKEQKLIFSGAETPIFIIQNDKYKIIKGNRHSIGYKKSDTNYQFTDHQIDINENCCIYITTDGYLDQNGGNKGFPYGKIKFKQLLENHYQKSFTVQQDILLESIYQYQGAYENTDDMTVIGIKF